LPDAFSNAETISSTDVPHPVPKLYATQPSHKNLIALESSINKYLCRLFLCVCVLGGATDQYLLKQKVFEELQGVHLPNP
jgi:hypothetical protein